MSAVRGTGVIDCTKGSQQEEGSDHENASFNNPSTNLASANPSTNPSTNPSAAQSTNPDVDADYQELNPDTEELELIEGLEPEPARDQWDCEMHRCLYWHIPDRFLTVFFHSHIPDDIASARNHSTLKKS